jgi:hypothetical protein
VDSGASFTFIPVWLFDGMVDYDEKKEINTGCNDANNKPLMGIAMRVELHFPDLPKLQESIFVIRNGPRGLIGQSSFFETFGAEFRGWPKAAKGREFAIYVPDAPATSVAGV